MSIIWSDEMELFGHRDVAYAWRKKGEALKPKNKVPTIRHGGGSIMLWAVSQQVEVGTSLRWRASGERNSISLSRSSGITFDSLLPNLV